MCKNINILVSSFYTTVNDFCDPIFSINLKALDRANGPVHRFRALRALLNDPFTPLPPPKKKGGGALQAESSLIKHLFAEGRVRYLFAEGRVRHGAFSG